MVKTSCLEVEAFGAPKVLQKGYLQRCIRSQLKLFSRMVKTTAFEDNCACEHSYDPVGTRGDGTIRQFGGSYERPIFSRPLGVKVPPVPGACRSHRATGRRNQEHAAFSLPSLVVSFKLLEPKELGTQRLVP